MSKYFSGLRRAVRFDPGLLLLRETAVTTAAMLAAYGSALLIEHLAHLRVDVVVQAVVLAATAARVQLTADRYDRLLGLAVLPAAAAGAAEVGRLMTLHPNLGDVHFTLGTALPIWVRRFGPRAGRAGGLLVLPLIALLVMPPDAGPLPGHDHTLWVALIALVSGAWVATAQAVAVRTGLVPAPVRPPAPAPEPADPGGTAPEPRPAARWRPLVHTRMALQMAGAVGGAFLAGRAVWPDHWAWVVLTAFIVCSGARGRADVLFKGLLRAVGAAAGTVVATAVAGSFGPHEDAAVVLIFAVLALATWLRELSYAYWAGCVTAVLSLLYGWFGQGSDDLLRTRLAAIGLGAAVGIAAAWLILPLRTRDVLRRRTADALAALTDLLGVAGTDRPALLRGRARFAYGVEQLGLMARPLRAERSAGRLTRRLTGRGGGRGGGSPADRPYRADVVDAVSACEAPLRVLVDGAVADPALWSDPRVARLNRAVAANTAAVRRSIGRRPGPGYQAVRARIPRQAGAAPTGTPEQLRMLAALLTVDDALGTMAGVFGDPPPAPPEDGGGGEPGAS
ncbi:FUSC family protein [Streptomyces sp. BE303]|uniref:FUSC family protein n=1 Tax=Streptomyces sp. BE303 TaxID=3002528 RepID=UPI002E77F244|nr:FUSC family protein [Streptomyces sp. BE303]MED7949059.1 FUSC family protein [Streptomyces sp. BE303]